MPIDFNQFLPTFFEESMEMLQEAEQILLQISPGIFLPDAIHSLFRFIHSIKGNAAAFNFTTINTLAHTLETFLDKVRTEKKPLTQEEIELIIQAVDCLTVMVTDVKNQTATNETVPNQLTKLLNEKLATGPAKETPLKTAEISADEKKPVVTGSPSMGWQINFLPEAGLLKMGDEPARIFSVLSEFGNLQIEVDCKKLPGLCEENYDPALCYLSWKIKLYSNISKNDIQEVFAWVRAPHTVSIDSFSEKNEKINTEIPLTPTKITTTSLRVPTQKIDHLMNMMSELVITQSVLNQVTTNFKQGPIVQLNETLQLLAQNSKELQESIMRIRMVPMDFLFNRFPRMVHDLEKQLQKKVSLIISGEQTEIDKNMIEKITDPLLHLIRNAIDHGIEPPEIREAQGKPSPGTIRLNADQAGGHIIITISDDGAGLNKKAILQKARSLDLIKENETITDDQLNQFIFQPGFSTSNHVSEISGRGVGLDVVAKNIEELGGEIEITSVEGKGTTFKLKLPLTLAIIDCQLVKLNEQIYIIPLNAISEMVELHKKQLKPLDHNAYLYYYREKYIPIIFLKKIFLINDHQLKSKRNFLIIAEVKNQLVGLVVDELLSQQQVVIQNLEEQYKKIPGISGITVLGDGSMALIIDVKETVALSQVTDSSVSFNKENRPSIDSMDIVKNTVSFQFLSFLMGAREFGIDISEVKEICVLETIAPLPNAPKFIKGAINLRGSIVPIIDLYERFSFPPIKHSPNNIIIILNLMTSQLQRCVGIVVEGVLDTYTIDPLNILPLPEQSNTELRPFIHGLVTVENRMITLLNAKTLLKLVVEQEMVL